MSSNSDSSFTVKQDETSIEIEVSSRPNSDFRNGSLSTASKDPELAIEKEKTEATASSDDPTKKPPFLAGIEVPEDDDGFKTPTSWEHRIPVMTECPPAPKKPWPPEFRKRKASPEFRRSFQFVFSEVFESKNKKARREKKD